MTTLTGAQARRRYLFLHGMQWLPTGLLIPVITLLMLERGLTVSEIGLVAATQGAVVLTLEVPTGGLADTLGRRPVLLLAGGFGLTSLLVLAVADTFPLFMLAAALTGVFRALESGPLEAWYVDAMLAADPDAGIEGGLSGAGAVLGGAVAAGALGSSALVTLHPVQTMSAMTLPVLVAAGLRLVGVVAVATLVTGPRRYPDRQTRPDYRGPWASIRDVPAVIRSAIVLLRRSRVLFALVIVELLWGVGAVSFEALVPLRLSEILADRETAAEIMGPAGTAAWLGSALGAGLVPVLSRFLGVPLAAALLRVGQGATVVAMALLAGPAGVVAAFVATYVVHGAANPLHMTLLHRQVDGDYRATVVSLNSMTGQIGLILGGVALTRLANLGGVGTAMIVGAAALAAAAPLYLTRAGAIPGRPAAASANASDAGVTGR